MVKGSGWFILVLALALSGCASKSVEEKIVYVDKPVEVQVPILKEPEFTRPTPPKDYVAELKKTSTSQQVVEAYVNTLKEWKRYARKLEVLVEPYFKK